MNIITKICSACGEIKPIDQFRKRKDSKDGLRGECIPCSHIVLNERRHRNPEQRRAGDKRYQEKNKNKIAEKRKDKYQKNIDAERERSRIKSALYRQKYPEKTKISHDKYRSTLKGIVKDLIYAKKYRNTHKKEIQEKRRKYNIENRDKRLLYKIKNKEHAAEKNREWYLKNIDAVREKNRERSKQYHAKHPEKSYASHKKWVENNPERARFLRIVGSKNYRNRKRGANGRFTSGEWKELCEKYSHTCLCCKQARKLEADHVVPISKGGMNTIDNIQPLCRSCNARKNNKTIDYRLTEPPSQ